MTFSYGLGLLSAILWLSGALAVLAKRRSLGVYLTLAGTLVAGFLIAFLWVKLARPPLRSMGETRLWYGFLLALSGLGAYRRWAYGWLLFFVSLVAGVFAVINALRPELQSMALPPALNSVFFIPHVVMYMLSYSLLAAATIAAIYKLRRQGQEGIIALKTLKAPKDEVKEKAAKAKELETFIHHSVRAGLGLLTLGLISGAVWAKLAWGHYWSWDPKETWAFVTVTAYLVHLHLAANRRTPLPTLTLLTLPLGLLFLMITWLGVSYLPTAPASVHVY
ncbi:MAG: cytochrome c biogenesis protein CcsA [Deltaproteobacteria bacterium]|jgi:ABC-type transport system involved in cytochrome c biogenesis permease subunit|nr:cytochrome c biogenesis protein CcsA [Deltaproteobacteria bacterium]